MQNFKYAKGKLKMKNFTTEDDDTMESMNKDDIHGLFNKYRTFGRQKYNYLF